MNHYNINGNQLLKLCSSLFNNDFVSTRLKNDLPISENLFSQDRIRTYSDGVLSINYAQPSDHGSYVCIISTASGANVRSKPATITVKCECPLKKYRLK